MINSSFFVNQIRVNVLFKTKLIFISAFLYLLFIVIKDNEYSYNINKLLLDTISHKK